MNAKSNATALPKMSELSVLDRDPLWGVQAGGSSQSTTPFGELLLVVGIPAFRILVPQNPSQHSQILNATFQNLNPPEIKSNCLITPQVDSTTTPHNRNNCKIFL